MPLASILSASALATTLASLGNDSSPALARALPGFSARIAMYFPLAIPMSPLLLALSASRINLSKSALGRTGSMIAATTWLGGGGLEFTGGGLLLLGFGLGLLAASSDCIREILPCGLPGPSLLMLAAWL